MDSILQDKKECYACGSQQNLQCHHIYRSANRKISEENGFKVWLCLNHHTGSNDGVHCKNGYALNEMIKCDCQAKYEETHTRKEFKNLIGVSYI